MTWQQSHPNRHWKTKAVIGRHTNWRSGFPEKTFAAHSMSLPCRWGGGARECAAMSKEQASFYAIKKILQRGQKESMLSLLIWPWVLLLWLFIGSWLHFCAEETPAEPRLPADRPDSWTHGWMAAHPIKPTGAHMLRKCVKTVGLCDWTHLRLVRVDMCACVLNSYRLIAPWWELNLSSPGTCGLIEGGSRQILLWLQTGPARQLVSQFCFFNTYLTKCERVLKIPSPSHPSSLHTMVYNVQARLLWINNAVKMCLLAERQHDNPNRSECRCSVF